MSRDCIVLGEYGGVVGGGKSNVDVVESVEVIISAGYFPSLKSEEMAVCAKEALMESSAASADTLGAKTLSCPPSASMLEFLDRDPNWGTILSP
jgi:hypothetical protein